MDNQLTEQQLAFYDTFGYLGFPGLLNDRIDEIISDYEEVWARHGGGHHGRPHDGKARSCIVQFIDLHDRLSTLLDDKRITGIASSLLGDDFNYMGSDGNYYAGDTRWHSDGRHVDIKHIKIAFYLDELTRDTGCLRVIPGSHKMDDVYADALQQHIGESSSLWGTDGPDIPAVALETTPGDIVCFNHNTKHAAFRRRYAAAHVYHEPVPALSGASYYGLARLYQRRGPFLDRGSIRRCDDTQRLARTYVSPGAGHGQ